MGKYRTNVKNCVWSGMERMKVLAVSALPHCLKCRLADAPRRNKAVVGCEPLGELAWSTPVWVVVMVVVCVCRGGGGLVILRVLGTVGKTWIRQGKNKV